MRIVSILIQAINQVIFVLEATETTLYTMEVLYVAVHSVLCMARTLRSVHSFMQ